MIVYNIVFRSYFVCIAYKVAFKCFTVKSFKPFTKLYLGQIKALERFLYFGIKSHIMSKKWWLTFLVVLFLPSVYSATIHGTIYNYDLDKAQNSIVVISTVPEQTFVAKDGTYILSVAPGDYELSASYSEKNGRYLSSKNISVVSDGDYLVDIILFPDLSEEQGLANEVFQPDIDVNLPTLTARKSTWQYYATAAIALIILFAIIFWLKKKPTVEPSEKDLADEVLDFVKHEQGRTTQKDIRNKFSFSEAKISLVLTELEHKGLVKKIKKGKGNIIILNR